MKPAYVALRNIKWKGEQIERGQVVPGVEEHHNLGALLRTNKITPYYDYTGEIYDPTNYLKKFESDRIKVDSEEEETTEQAEDSEDKQEEVSVDDLEQNGSWFHLPNGEKVQGEEKAKEELAEIQSN
jgi:hypothetical protein